MIAVFYYGEKSITKGEKYGITIGDSKDKVYSELSGFLSRVKSAGDKVFIRIKVTEASTKLLATDTGFDIFVEPYFHIGSGEEFKQSDRWVFYLNASSLDVVELRFESEKLTEIYRNKRLIELP